MTETLWRLALSFSPPQVLHPFADNRLVATVDRLVISTFFRQIVLGDPAVRVIVRVFVVFAMPELRGSLVVCIAQVEGHLQRSAIANVLPRFVDRQIGGVGFWCSG